MKDESKRLESQVSHTSRLAPRTRRLLFGERLGERSCGIGRCTGRDGCATGIMGSLRVPYLAPRTSRLVPRARFGGFRL